MTWVKLDDQFCEHPRITQLTDRAFRLHVASLGLANRKLTDGHISELDSRVLRALTSANLKHIRELMAAGLWERNGQGWNIRDFLDYNPTAESVKERRRKDAQRKRGNP